MKSKIQIGILALLVVVSFAGCQNNEEKQNHSNENLNNNIVSGLENDNENNKEIEEEESGDFPTNPKDVLGNKINFTDTLEFATTSGVSYQITKDGTKLIDNTTKNERNTNGIQGTIKSFICEAETESKEDMLNFIVLNEAGKLFVAHLENESEATINFKEVNVSEKVVGIGVAKAGYADYENSILKTESGRLMKITCTSEEDENSAYLNDYIPAVERAHYNMYMKLIGEYEFVEAKKLEAAQNNESAPIFQEGTTLILENPIPHGTIALSSAEASGEKLVTFWWDIYLEEKIANMYLTRAFEEKEELTFTYEESAEGMILNVMDSNYEIKFQKK